MAQDLYGMIVYGYLRQNETCGNVKTPKDVQEIIFMFYPKLLPFEWNQNENEHGGGFEFDDNSTTVTYSKHKWSLVKSKQAISCFIASRIKWSIKILDMNESEKIYFRIGFFPSSKVAMIQDYEKGGFDKIGLDDCDVFSFEIHTGFEYFYKWGRDGNDVAFTSFKHDKNFKKGDEFSLIFYFESSKCALFYNGGLVGIIYEKIPSEPIVPAIICYSNQLCSDKYTTMTLRSQIEMLRL